MNKIDQIIASLPHLLEGEENENQFRDSFTLPSPVSIRIHPKKMQSLPDLPKIPWSDYGYYLQERPVFTLDPLFHSGAYYVQEPGSMFIGHIFKQIKPSTAIKVLDLCAAPGGKTTLLQSYLNNDDLLVANETNASRIPALRENCMKWGESNCLITSNTSKDFSKMEHFFDVILVDAPCSGEGMIRKDPKALEDWSIEIVQQCAIRQKEILTDAWHALRPGGILIYSTCTFNAEENENILIWMQRELMAQHVPIHFLPHWQISVTENSGIKGYHFLPHKVNSEGFFAAVVQKPESDEAAIKKKEVKNRIDFLQNNELKSQLRKWLYPSVEYEFFQKKEEIIGLPKIHCENFLFLNQHLHIVQSGIHIATLKGNDLLPHPDFAHSTDLNLDYFSKIEVDEKTALNYLKRNTIKFNVESGWHLITYKNSPLGWIKQIDARSNNYFPKERRIKMELPKSVK